MRTRSFLFFILGCILATVSLINAAPPEKPNASVSPAITKDVCLECHSPFDDLAAKPKTFTAESGEKINPHRFVPHDRKSDKGIPNCTNCHRPHPTPFTSQDDVIKPNVDWCYSCHHNNDFQACGDCHK